MLAVEEVAGQDKEEDDDDDQHHNENDVQVHRRYSSGHHHFWEKNLSSTSIYGITTNQHNLNMKGFIKLRVKRYGFLQTFIFTVDKW